MTARRVSAGVAGAVLAAALWVYLQQLRFERSFYRRWLLEAGKDPNRG